MREISLAAVLLSAAAAAGAQISPGELSLAHAGLEGNDRCLECHRKGRGVDSELCLTCHRPLKARIDAGLGLHAEPGYEDCRTCHIEHHGRAFELIFWNGGGPGSLDHALTGYELEGKHAALACRDCHRSALVRAKKELVAAGKDLDRTFLGLETSCLSCHSDPHRGQFEDAPCRSCHELSAWRPAPLFDHRKTSFPLTGRHRDVACAKCHPEVAESRDVRFVRYSGVLARSCTSCHDDPHTSRFGTRCESCHATESWRARVDEASFDHDRTRYPLRGRHRLAACADCHTSKRNPSGKLTEPIAGFDRCETCHADAHAGQFRGRPDRGACASCHDVEGFCPSRYTLEDHQGSSYPLEGSHLAIPCFSCHAGPAPPAARRSPSESAGGAYPTKLTRFVFESTACTVCHEDPHDGSLDAYFAPGSRDSGGCVTCHDLALWRSISFDHGRSDFQLTGRHANAACESCHPRDQGGPMKLAGVPTTCAGCHDDPHGGQFERQGRAAACESCHTVLDWRPSRFDHDRDSAYALEGAHREVPCAGCHPTVIAAERTWVRYRPRPTECTGCHRGGRP